MKRFATVFILLVFTLGCNSTTSNTGSAIPLSLQPDWEGISDLPFAFGDVVQIAEGTMMIKAIVIDFNEDEDGLWIGLCFISQNQLFGRQIPSGMVNTTCLDLLDLTYIPKEALHDIEVIQSLKLDKTKIGMGSISTATKLSEIKSNFEIGITKRKKEQTPCDQGIIDTKAVRECYFNVEKIKL